MRMLGLAVGLMLSAMSALLLTFLVVGIAASGHPMAVFHVGILGFILQLGPVLVTLVPGLLLISLSRRRGA